jgi:hypothetical protein
MTKCMSLFSEMRRRLVIYKFINHSGEYIASIFEVEQEAKKVYTDK